MQSNIKYSFLVWLAVSSIGLLHADDQNGKQDAEPLSRYQEMIGRSPFALATEAAPPPPALENVGFTKDLVLTGAVRLNGGEYITVESKDHNQRFSLKNGEAYNEISLVSVAWSDAIGKTKATLKKGTEFGTIGFDEAAAQNGSVSQPPRNAGAGGPPGQPPGNTFPNGQPSQPPGMVAQPQSTPKSPGPNPVVIRRVRPISSASTQ